MRTIVATTGRRDVGDLDRRPGRQRERRPGQTARQEATDVRDRRRDRQDEQGEEAEPGRRRGRSGHGAAEERDRPPRRARPSQARTAIATQPPTGIGSNRTVV